MLKYYHEQFKPALFNVFRDSYLPTWGKVHMKPKIVPRKANQIPNARFVIFYLI